MSEEHTERTMQIPTKSEVVDELKAIYSDPYVHIFVVFSFGMGIALGSFVIALAVITLLSAWYIGTEKHHDR